MSKSKRNNLVMPFLKWAGGKRQLLPEILARLPKTKFTTYYEPFVGGGALFFYLQPKKAIINDFNHDLINTYKVISTNVDDLIKDLSKHMNTSEYYYNIRSLDRDSEKFNSLSDIEKASRLIYLNKTCYNGLFRVNGAGEFNSPFGYYKNPNISNEITLRAINQYFNEASIVFVAGDFENVLKNTKKGSFVYLDPPYDPVSTSSNFTGYTNQGFGKEEQIRLKNVCDALDRKGIKFLLSNSATAFIKELYAKYIIDVIPARRTINSNASLRGEVDEVLIRNYLL